MIGRFKVLGVVVVFLLGGVPVFAQGEASVCLGDMSGVVISGGVNVGKISFDAHEPYVAGKEVSLGILGLGSGYAPGSKGNAACSERSVGRYNGSDYDHRLKGYAWSENLGFISLDCESGRNVSGEVGGGTACGPFDYGVYVGLPAVANGDGNRPFLKGERAVLGYAWNAVFGYMAFNNLNFPEYGVRVKANGKLDGYAWTEAGVWVDMTGVAVEIFPDSEPPVVPKDPKDVNPVLGEWCAGRPFLCAEVDPFVAANKVVKSGNDDGGEFDIGLDEGVRVADGVDGYGVHLYLRGPDGKAIDPALYDLKRFKDSIRFVWTDTVKRLQLNSDVQNYGLVSSPWNDSSGGVFFKPLNFKDLVGVVGDSGHYVAKQKVTSYAPTSSANVSFSSGEPPFPFRNELSLKPVEGVPVNLPPNRLVLERIEYGSLMGSDGVEVLPPGVIFPNGRLDGTELHFRPAVAINTLYANANEDEIQAYRGVPVNFRIGGEILGNLPKAALSSAIANFTLHYSKQETEADGCNADNFDFGFTGNLDEFVIDGEKKLSGLDFIRYFTQPRDIQAVASLPELVEGEEEVALPCKFAKSPSFVTSIGYNIGAKVIQYYSNKLPKSAGAIANPSIVIHGNVYGQKVGNVAGDNRVQLQGSLDTNVVRDKVNGNLAKYGADGLVEPAKQGKCVVSALNTATAKGYTIAGKDCNGKAYRVFVVGDENVLYVKGQDVVLDLKTGSTRNQWVVLVDGGNIFMKSDINNGDDSARRLTLVTFRDPDDNEYFKTGHGYLAGGKAMVVDATMVFDGTLFSYSGDEAQVMSAKGEPVWASDAARRQALSYQALIRGSIYSDNTIGGADLDGGRTPKDYVLLGGGEIIKSPISNTDRMRAQAYDLNYLRMFTLEIERCDNGYPKDQVCGRCLAPEDIVAIAGGERLCGEKGVCNARGDYVCNGINSALKYDGGRQASGDLVPPRDPAKLVSGAGLDAEEDFDPVYVFFRAPNRSSFIFK